MLAINANLKKPLSEENLKKSFERWWSPFEQKVNDALKQVHLVVQSKPKQREAEEILEEILAIVRSLQRTKSPGFGSLAERLLTTTPPQPETIDPNILNYLKALRDSDEQPIKTCKRNAWAEALASLPPSNLNVLKPPKA
jgi:hypothetical protein